MQLNVQENHLKMIQDILQHHVPHHRVWAFGSRINGLATHTSDLDLCILGSTPISLELMSTIRDAFSLSMIPYKVDVLDWSSIHASFQNTIEKEHVAIQDPDNDQRTLR